MELLDVLKPGIRKNCHVIIGQKDLESLFHGLDTSAACASGISAKAA